MIPARVGTFERRDEPAAGGEEPLSLGAIRRLLDLCHSYPEPRQGTTERTDSGSDQPVRHATLSSDLARPSFQGDATPWYRAALTTCQCLDYLTPAHSGTMLSGHDGAKTQD